MSRQRLRNRRASTTFEIDAALAYTVSYSRFPDGTVGEVFLTNHKTNSAADVNARDAAIACSFALQHGADIESIRKALCRGSQGNASGPLGAALDHIAEMESGK
jgi:hypothetical protein